MSTTEYRVVLRVYCNLCGEELRFYASYCFVEAKSELIKTCVHHVHVLYSGLLNKWLSFSLRSVKLSVGSPGKSLQWRNFYEEI